MNEQLNTFLQKPGVVPAATGVVGFGGGLALGFFLWRRKKKEFNIEVQSSQLTLPFDIQDYNARDLAVTKQIIESNGYATVDEDEKSFAMALTEMLTEKNETSQIKTLSDLVPNDEIIIGSEEPTAVNVFGGTSSWDHEAELAARTDSAPYIIHRDEFFGDEMEWDSQSVLTWYAGDQTLAAEDNSIIYDVKGVVGELRFGHGSGDPNVVYIRNPVREAEYEVVLDTGRYEELIMGLSVETEYEEADLKHSRMPMRFRGE